MMLIGHTVKIPPLDVFDALFFYFPCLSIRHLLSFSLFLIAHG